jgi:hypothetical protein
MWDADRAVLELMRPGPRRREARAW